MGSWTLTEAKKNCDLRPPIESSRSRGRQPPHADKPEAGTAVAHERWGGRRSGPVVHRLWTLSWLLQLQVAPAACHKKVPARRLQLTCPLFWDGSPDREIIYRLLRQRAIRRHVRASDGVGGRASCSARGRHGSRHGGDCRHLHEPRYTRRQARPRCACEQESSLGHSLVILEGKEDIPL